MGAEPEPPEPDEPQDADDRGRDGRGGGNGEPADDAQPMDARASDDAGTSDGVESSDTELSEFLLWPRRPGAALRTAGQRGEYFKDVPDLQRAPLAPPSPVAAQPEWAGVRRQVARTFNRVGGLMRAVSVRVGVEPAAGLAVWYVESAGRAHTPNRALIRFENHLLFRRWGRNNLAAYNRHFRHGGHQGQPGKPWKNHQFRETADGPFRAVHGDQAREYQVLEFASRLAGRELALSCISIGGPQILISNHALIGYASGQAMYDAFQASERWQVLGFFDFCRHRRAPRRGDLFIHMRDRNWRKFARFYNGAGQTEKYGSRIGNAYAHARGLGG